MKEQKNELFFVEVKQPNQIRKHILETLKDILEVLHRFEKFRSMRHKKLESIQKLRAMLKDANKMLGTLKLKLPQTNLRATVVKESLGHRQIHHKKKKRSSKEEKAEKPQKREMTETEKLEAELNAIESKLKSLT